MTEAGCKTVSTWLRRWGVEHDQVVFAVSRGPTGLFVAQAYAGGYWREVCAVPAAAAERGELEARMLTLCDECGCVMGYGLGGVKEAIMVHRPGFVKWDRANFVLLWCEDCWPEQQRRQQMGPLVALSFELARLDRLGGMVGR